MSDKIELIVGLGNPGSEYEATRHNVGFWFIDAIAQKKGEILRHEKKFFGETGSATIEGNLIRLLKPQTYMNRSGSAVYALANYYKIAPQNILVVHDELDLLPGIVRVKQGGGHAGHNGLRDIVAQVGANFFRLRIGIGRPEQSRDVTPYVLGRPPSLERERIEDTLTAALSNLPLIASGQMQKSMNHLHTLKPE